MKKKLIGLALIGVTTLGVSSVSALTMDLSTFKGYGECKTTGDCDGTNIVIIGHRMYQLNNHDIVLSGPLYTKAQLEYGTTEAPIYYLLDGGEVLQEVGPYKVSLKATPKEQRTMEQIGGYNYEITMIDDVSLEDIEDKDEVNDDALTEYVKKLETLVSSYEALDKIEYSEETNTLKFTINKVGLEKKLAEFFTKTEEGEDISILDMFATYLADAIRASYNVDGKTNTSVDIEKGAVELAKSLLLAMAQNNGYKVTNAGELTYGMVANTSATGTFVYETKGLEQTVKYTLEFYYDASDDIDALEESKDEANDTAVSGVIDGIKLDEYKTTEDQKPVLRNPNGVKYDNASNTLTFDVTRDGLNELLSSFASVKKTDGTVLDSILEAFQSQITDDKELDSITFKVNNGSEVTVQAEDGAVEIAKALLLAMANANGSEVTDPTQLTYLDVIGTKATATFSYKVPYTKEKATLTYTVEFKYDPNTAEINAEKKEMQEAIDTLFLNDVAKGFSEAVKNYKNDQDQQILDSITYKDQTLTFKINKNGLHSGLATFADLEATVNLENLKQMLEELLGEEVQMQTSGPVHIAELFDFFKELGITEASYEVNGKSHKVNLEDAAESIAAALLKEMAGGNKSASSLEFLDVVGKTGKGKFTFAMEGCPDKTYELEYTLEFKYEPNMTQERKEREEASDKLLEDYANTVLEQITGGDLSEIFDATKTKYDEETKTVTFAVKETGLEESIVNFLDTDAGASIVDVFAKFAEGAIKASYTVGGNEVPVLDLSNPVEIAGELLKKMSGTEKNPSALTYKDIVDGTKEAKGKFTYSVEGSEKTVEIEYTLKFEFEKSLLEVNNQKAEVAKESLKELNTALHGDTDNVENSTYNEDTKTLAIELTEGAQTKTLSETILNEQGEESIVPVVESLMDGAKSVNYKVSQVNYFDEKAGLAAASLKESSETITLDGSKTAKEVAEDIILKAAQQVRLGASKADLKYSDLKNVKVEMQFTYDVPGEKEDATTDYIIEFLYATDTEKVENAKEIKDTSNDTVLEGMKTQLNTALQNKPTVSKDKDSDGSKQEQIDKAYAALSSIEFDAQTNKIEFNVTKEGLTTELSSFLVVGVDPNSEENDSSDIPIINMFNQFAKGSNKIEYVIGNATVEDKFSGTENKDKKVVPSSQYLSGEGEPEPLSIMILAAGLLSDMSTGSVSEQSNIGGMMSAKYSSVVGETHQATARFYYTDEETSEEYYVEYTLIFNNPTVD